MTSLDQNLSDHGVGWRESWILVGLLALTTIVYWPMLKGPLIGDAEQIVTSPHFASADGWRECLTESFTYPVDPSRDEYRPVTSLSFWLQVQLSGTNPLWFHWLDLLIHLAVVLSLFGVATQLFDSRVGWVAAAVFALHPAWSEGVASVIARADQLATLFALLAWRCHLARRSRAGWGRAGWTLGSIGFVVLAVLSKESGLSILALLWVTDWLRIGPWPATDLWASLRRHVPLWSSLLLALGLRLLLRGAVWTGAPEFFVYNPLEEAGLSARMLTASWLLFKALGLFVWPWKLSFDYSWAQIPLVESWLEPRAGAIVVLSLATVWLARYAWQRGNRVPTWIVLGFLALSVVTSNLLFTTGTIFAERLLYLPGTVLSIGAGWTILGVLRKQHGVGENLAILVAVIPLMLLAVRTFDRSLDWVSWPALLQRQIEVAPNSVRTWKQAALLALDEDRPQVALVACERALGITERWSDAWMACSEAQLHAGRAGEAFESAQRAYELGEQSPGWYRHTIGTLVVARRLIEAAALADRGHQRFPEDPGLAALAEELARRTAEQPE